MTLPAASAPPRHHEVAALGTLVRAVVAAVLGEGREHPDVEDATHEALRRAMEAPERLAAANAVRPFVLGIARHVALDVLRARQRDRARHDRGTPDEEESPLARVADPGPVADERLDSAQRARLVARALSQLPQGQREALELFHGEGLSYQEVAARMDVPLGTVATWVTRGRKTLSEVLRDA